MGTLAKLASGGLIGAANDDLAADITADITADPYEVADERDYYARDLELGREKNPLEKTEREKLAESGFTPQQKMEYLRQATKRLVDVNSSPTLDGINLAEQLQYGAMTSPYNYYTKANQAYIGGLLKQKEIERKDAERSLQAQARGAYADIMGRGLGDQDYRDVMNLAIMSGDMDTASNMVRLLDHGRSQRGSTEFERSLEDSGYSEEEKQELRRRKIEQELSPQSSGRLVIAIDPATGQETYVTQEEALEGGYKPRPTQDKESSKPLPAPAIKKLEDSKVKFDQIDRLASGFQDDFGGYKSEMVGDVANWAGRTFGDDSGGAQWWQDYQDYINQVRNELFGASLTPGEKSEFTKAVVTPAMDSKEIKKNLKRQRDLVDKALSRTARVYEKGGYSKDQISQYYQSADGADGDGEKPKTSETKKRMKWNPETQKLEPQ